MARKTALMSLGAVLLVCLTLVTVVRSTHGQEDFGQQRDHVCQSVPDPRVVPSGLTRTTSSVRGEMR